MAPVQRHARFRVCASSGGARERSSDMRRALLGFAALTAALTVSTPTLALDRALVGTPTAPADRFGGSPGFRGDVCRDSRRDRDGERRRGRDVCRSEVVTDWYGGEWALYNNRSWAPDSYND